MAAVKDLLWTTLRNFRFEELKKFQWFLKFTQFQMSRPVRSPNDLVDHLVETAGQRAVEVTMEVLQDMNRTDLVKELSESSGLTG